MFYFIMKIAVYLLLIIIIYHYYSKNRINILNFLIIFFLLNKYFVLLYKDINIIIGILITFLVLIIERLYNYLYLNNNEVNKNKILIKNGNINFNNLINNKYSYHKLIKNIKRKGIKDLSKIDYCVLYKNDLIVFSDNINNYPVNLIIDGKVINNNLNSLKKNREWLNKSLKENNLLIKDVSYAFYKDNQIYFLTNV